METAKAMKSILVDFLLQMLILVQPLLGGKHNLADVADSSKSGKGHHAKTLFTKNGLDFGLKEDSSTTVKGKLSNKENDYVLNPGLEAKILEDWLKHNKEGQNELINADQCKGIKNLCKGRPTCLEAIECDGRNVTSNQTEPQDAPQDGAQKDAPQDGASQGDRQTRQNEFLPVEHKKPQ